jgi:putative membrane protein
VSDPVVPPTDPAPVTAAGPSTALTAGLADGEWHRLHPATPLLRGGLYLVAIIGIVIANLRERLVEWFLPGVACPPGDVTCSEDPIGQFVNSGYLLIGLLVVLGVLLLLIALFYVSWRMHTFRVTGEVVEVKSGVLFRTHRKARLDRIQGVSVSRPLFARLFGAAKLDVEVAGQDANVQLSYLGTAASDVLRADILRLASGSRAASAAQPAGGGAAGGSLVERRVSELLAPELHPDAAPPESVVRMPVGRLIGSTLLSGSLVWLLVLIAVVVTVVTLTLTVSSELVWVLFTVVPITFGFGSYLVNRVIKFLRYSIAATPDGVRIGYGLFSTRNDTLPPGRIHSVAVSQNLAWRPADWWTVRVNRASRTTSSSGDGSTQQQATIVLPVGTRDDVFKVLALLLPELLGTSTAKDGTDLRALLEHGLAGKGGDDEFTTSPRRAAVLRWFSWRRNGFALFPGVALLRRGAIWRELAIVPTPRIQSVAVEQGPLERALRLAGVHLHTVAGPISPRIGALSSDDAQALFRDAASAAVAAAGADRSHRWRSGEA